MGTILGPEESAYAGGVFLIDIKLSTEYPWKAPVVKFKTPIYHPNITR
jgi:ubiquitin-protein ligase